MALSPKTARTLNMEHAKTSCEEEEEEQQQQQQDE